MALDWSSYILIAAAVIFAITLHECAHGYVAHIFGDNTAKDAGRLTLNPIKHIDMVGTILIPGSLILASVLVPAMPLFLFGWAKPVPVVRSNLRNPRKHMPFVALAGPASNLAQAIFWALVYKISLGFIAPEAALSGFIVSVCMAGIMINVVLMCLNLLPILPLDGGRVVQEILPLNLAVKYAKFEKFGLIIVIALLLSPFGQTYFFELVMHVTTLFLRLV